MKTHPCLSCGVCCAFYRVSFHWSETLAESHGVPLELTKSITIHKSAMNGTNQIKPSCVALLGSVGKSTSCGIYNNRPSACRNFKASFEDGLVNKDCETARLSKGLDCLTLADWPIPI
ncbi:YkgJ family cysteine cluster protein [bacterium]|nr:YkgJ family cysteine cluster protein [bacterium]